MTDKNNCLTVISSYPPKGRTHSPDVVGVATYSKRLLTAVSASGMGRITVLAEKNGETEYTENGIRIKRIWERNGFTSILKTFFRAGKMNAGKVLIPFELKMFGGAFSVFASFLGMTLLKAYGKKVYLVMHQSLDSFSGLEGNIIRRKLLDFAKDILYKILLSMSERAIVFEKGLAGNLKTGEGKIAVLPHLVEKGKAMDREKACSRLGLPKDRKYVLYFGYLSPYKGIDWLVENWPERGDIWLIVAGGINPNYANDGKFRKFAEKVKKLSENRKIILTGFVPEDKIRPYYSASEAVILPYKSFFSSSGPLSFAFTYGRKIMLSEKLDGYLESGDFRNAMEKAGLKRKDIIFSFNKNDLARILGDLNRRRKEFMKFAGMMSGTRDSRQVALQFCDCLGIR